MGKIELLYFVNGLKLSCCLLRLGSKKTNSIEAEGVSVCMKEAEI